MYRYIDILRKVHEYFFWIILNVLKGKRVQSVAVIICHNNFIGNREERRHLILLGLLTVKNVNIQASQMNSFQGVQFSFVNFSSTPDNRQTQEN